MIKDCCTIPIGKHLFIFSDTNMLPILMKNLLKGESCFNDYATLITGSKDIFLLNLKKG